MNVTNNTFVFATTVKGFEEGRLLGKMQSKLNAVLGQMIGVYINCLQDQAILPKLKAIEVKSKNVEKDMLSLHRMIISKAADSKSLIGALRLLRGSLKENYTEWRGFKNYLVNSISRYRTGAFAGVYHRFEQGVMPLLGSIEVIKAEMKEKAKRLTVHVTKLIISTGKKTKKLGFNSLGNFQYQFSKNETPASISQLRFTVPPIKVTNPKPILKGFAPRKRKASSMDMSEQRRTHEDVATEKKTKMASDVESAISALMRLKN